MFTAHSATCPVSVEQGSGEGSDLHNLSVCDAVERFHHVEMLPSKHMASRALKEKGEGDKW